MKIDTKNKNMKYSLLEEIAEDTVSKLQDGIGDNSYGCDLHHELWNTDYYIIGTYKAERFIKQHMSVFDAIHEVQEYEKDNFGETNTDVSSPEKVVNMLAYIYGYEVLESSKHLVKNWDRRLDEEDLEIVIEEIEEEYGLR